MEGSAPAARPTARGPRDGGHSSEPVAWMLILLAMGVFTPCVLLPEWRTYQALSEAEQVEQHRVDSLKTVVDRERHILEATRDDPAVLARLAQRDLGFRQAGEKSISVDVPPVTSSSEEAFTPKPEPLPPSLARLAGYLPEYDYDAVFCDGRTRLTLMAMSCALLVIALCLPGRCGRWPTYRRPVDSLRST